LNLQASEHDSRALTFISQKAAALPKHLLEPGHPAMNSKVFMSCVLLLCLFGMSSFAAPLTPPLADDVMEELSSIPATLGSSDSETDPEAVPLQEAANAEVDLVQTASSMHNDFASTSVGGYTFYRVPFTSSTSSNVDIRNTCQKHGMIAPCDAGKGYDPCDGCTVMPTETLSSKCGNQHFSYGGYVPPDYKETDCYKNWPGDKGAWDKFMPDTHIMQNWNCGTVIHQICVLLRCASSMQ